MAPVPEPSKMKADSIPIGYKLNGRYETIEKIGKGGSGSVYKVKDHLDGKMKAAKAMNKDRDGNADYRSEVDALTKLETLDGVPTLFDNFLEASINVYVTELFVIDLYKLWENGPKDGMGLEVVLSLAYHIFDILKDIHSMKFIHRDIKPTNIALKFDHAQCKTPICILDYGMAFTVPDDKKPARDLTFTETTYATPNMFDGWLCTKSDDLLMAVYGILELLGIDAFGFNEKIDKKEIMKRKKRFETHPMEFQQHDWIGELVKEIKRKEGNGEHNYARILSIVKRAKRNFSPHLYKIQLLKNDEGKLYI